MLYDNIIYILAMPTPMNSSVNQINAIISKEQLHGEIIFYPVPGRDSLVKGVQCYKLFGGIVLKIHTFSFFFFIISISEMKCKQNMFSVHVSINAIKSKIKI